jgi:hypothetical protein
MATHLSSIGFHLASIEELAELTRQVAGEASEQLVSPHGVCLRWTAECGAELWLQLDREGHLAGIHPHFNGQARFALTLTEAEAATAVPGLEGTLRGESANGEAAGPLAFDVPDLGGLVRRLRLPGPVGLQVAAFAHELDAVEPAGEASEDGPPLELEARSLSVDDRRAPLSGARVNGRVLAFSEKLNPVSGEPFVWARLEVPGGELDMVAEPDQLPGPLDLDVRVSGAFWLSARIRMFHEEPAPGVTIRIHRG